jgi:hypothetical protein
VAVVCARIPSGTSSTGIPLRGPRAHGLVPQKWDAQQGVGCWSSSTESLWTLEGEIKVEWGANCQRSRVGGFFCQRDWQGQKKVREVNQIFSRLPLPCCPPGQCPSGSSLHQRTVSRQDFSRNRVLLSYVSMSVATL